MSNTKTKCKIAQVLPAGTLALIEQQPENEVNRALVLQKMKIPIPDELKTYSEIKDWIEATFDPGPDIDPDATAFPDITVTQELDESGTCNFERHLTLNYPYGVGNRDMERWLQQTLEDNPDAKYPDIIRDVKENILSSYTSDDFQSSDAVESQLSISDIDDSDWANYRASLSDHQVAVLTTRVAAWLRANHPGQFGL
jgi:hypothetical protein